MTARGDVAAAAIPTSARLATALDEAISLALQVRADANVKRLRVFQLDQLEQRLCDACDLIEEARQELGAYSG